MTKRRKLALISAAVPAALLVLFFATAKYGDDHHGVHYINRPPFADVAWGPSWRFIVQQGVKVVPDPERHGAAGNVIEFPVSPHTRVSMRLLSRRWFRERLFDWESSHPRIAGWLGLDRCPQQPECQRIAQRDPEPTASR